MERMLVAVFDTEKQAYEGLKSLNKLDLEGSIAIFAEAVIQKNADGTITTKQVEEDFPIRTLSGTALGSLIGLLAGPAGLAVGAAAGFVAGIIGDARVAGVDADFLHDVSLALMPGKYAVVADIDEEWITPVDSTIEGLGGFVFRSARSEVEAEQRARYIAEIKKELAQMEAEYAQAQADRKAALQAKIDALNKKLHDQVEQAKSRAEALKNEANAKVNALQQKAATTRGKAKTLFETRIAEIREHHKQQEAKLKSATAAKLREAAAKLEKAAS